MRELKENQKKKKWVGRLVKKEKWRNDEVQGLKWKVKI